jgi:acyl-CoA synthetase (AMP-forming)/AMP-acid ligase II
MTEGHVATGFRALLRSRLLVLPGPAALPRVVREVGRGGTNLATLLGIAAARWPSRAAVIDVSIREFLKDKVSRFEQPRDVKFVEKIPRNPAGKVLRHELEPSAK